MAEILQGVSFPGTNTPVVPSNEIFNVNDCTNLAIDTYRSLGMVTDYDSLRKDFQDRLQTLHELLVIEHLDGTEYEPLIGLELPNDFAFQVLLAAFDDKQSIITDFDELLWKQYCANELNSRVIGATKTPEPTSLGAVRGEALAMLIGGGDHADEPGLYDWGKEHSEQKNAVNDFKDSYDSDYQLTEILIANPADYIILNAQRREAGRPLLDLTTVTRFVQLATKRASKELELPIAFTQDSGKKLNLHGYSGGKSDIYGVRLLVGQKAA
jgi:hypothetical protein